MIVLGSKVKRRFTILIVRVNPTTASHQLANNGHITFFGGQMNSSITICLVFVYEFVVKMFDQAQDESNQLNIFRFNCIMQQVSIFVVKVLNGAGHCLFRL